MRLLLKNPSAWLPLVMSLFAICLLSGYLIHGLFYGLVYQEDEGIAAHLWQILIAGQLPIVFIFAIKYLPTKPRQAFKVLVLQALAFAIACAPVFLLGL